MTTELTIADAGQLAIAYQCGLAVKIREKRPLAPQDIINYARIVSQIPINALTAFYQFHEDGSQAGEDEIFVFGSNLAGIHGAGAARAALEHYGAIFGQGKGLVGRSYAIATKDEKIETLPMKAVVAEIANFKAFAILNPDKKFFMTRVGCGLAGFTDEEIAPLFIGSPENVNFPANWGPWLGNGRRVEKYRMSMTDDVLRAWAADAELELERLNASVNLLGAGDD